MKSANSLQSHEPTSQFGFNFVPFKLQCRKTDLTEEFLFRVGFLVSQSRWGRNFLDMWVSPLPQFQFHEEQEIMMT